MQIVSLEPSLEQAFWDHVNKDLPHYYFFALDWKFNRDKTDIFLAVEGSRIIGMMLIYKGTKIHLRGNRKSTKEFLKRLTPEDVELTIPDQHKEAVLNEFEITSCHHMMLMLLYKGRETTHIEHPIVELGVSDAERIATIMKNADPEFWGKATSREIEESMDRKRWFGIEKDGQLVSICGTSSTEWPSHISTVATIQGQMNKGYATSVVSYAVKQLLKKHSTIMIYVLEENSPAIRVYKKVGFTPYKKYFHIRGSKR